MDFRIDADGRIRLPSGRFAPREIVERAALRGGVRVELPTGRTLDVPIVAAHVRGERSIRGTRGARRVQLEEGAAVRVKRDRTARELGAVRFKRADSAEGPGVESYALPKPLPLDAAAQALRNVVDSAAGGELDKFARAHVVAKLVGEDGAIMYRALSHAKIGSGAVNEGAATLAGWARKYKKSRLIGIDVVRLGEREAKRNERREESKREGARIRARERRDWRAGGRTTRGR